MVGLTRQHTLLLLSLSPQLLMTDLLPKVESETLTVMSDTILQFSVGSHASTGITAAMVKELLDVCLNFSKDLQQRFRLAFDKRNSAVRQYGRCVALACSSVYLANLSDVLGVMCCGTWFAYRPASYPVPRDRSQAVCLVNKQLIPSG